MQFKNYGEAKRYAQESGLPLWDTHTLPYRYYVGHLTADMEEDPDNAGWEEIEVHE